MESAYLTSGQAFHTLASDSRSKEKSALNGKAGDGLTPITGLQ